MNTQKTVIHTHMGTHIQYIQTHPHPPTHTHTHTTKQTPVALHSLDETQTIVHLKKAKHKRLDSTERFMAH